MRQRLAGLALALAVGVFVAALRFLSVGGFSNDHYMHLAEAQQIAFGEWPTRDYVDFGMPLMPALSSVSFMVMPEAPLLGEAVLVAMMFGLAATLTLFAARRLTGWWWIAVLVVALEVAIFPRTYSYPKVLTYAAGFLAMWRYVDRPTLPRMAQLALVIVCSFLLRYDHGMYLGVGGLLTVIVAAVREGVSVTMRKTATYGVVLLLFLAPYLVYIQYYDGLWRHVMRGVELQVVEADRGRTMPDFEFGANLVATNAVPLLFYLFHLLPVAVAVVALLVWRRAPSHSERAMLVPLIVVALLVDVGLIRDTLSARLPDAIVPAVLLLGWLLATVVRLRPSPAAGLAWAVAASVMVITAASMTAVGGTKEQLQRTEVFDGPARLLEQFGSRAAELRQRFPMSHIPSRVAYTMLPFFRYADRCLGPGDHLLVPAFLPEASVWARRPFAGGQLWFQPGLLARDEDHSLVMRRLRAQRVPVGIFLQPSSDGILAQFPELNRYVRERFTNVTWLATDDGRVVRIAFDPELAVGRDPETGWYCYR